jgi:hypothetical protein
VHLPLRNGGRSGSRPREAQVERRAHQHPAHPPGPAVRAPGRATDRSARHDRLPVRHALRPRRRPAGRRGRGVYNARGGMRARSAASLPTTTKVGARPQPVTAPSSSTHHPHTDNGG